MSSPPKCFTHIQAPLPRSSSRATTSTRPSAGARDGPRGSWWKAFKWIYIPCIAGCWLDARTKIYYLQQSSGSSSNRTEKENWPTKILFVHLARRQFPHQHHSIPSNRPPPSYCFPIAKQMPNGPAAIFGWAADSQYYYRLPESLSADATRRCWCPGCEGREGNKDEGGVIHLIGFRP